MNEDRFFNKYGTQVINAELVKKAASETEYTLRRFITNDSLELYFDVYSGIKSVCYIFRGWGDPGFRVGAFVDISKERRTSHEYRRLIRTIFKICARNNVELHSTLSDLENATLALEYKLYNYGFCGSSLNKAIDAVAQVCAEIQYAFPGDIIFNSDMWFDGHW